MNVKCNSRGKACDSPAAYYCLDSNPEYDDEYFTCEECEKDYLLRNAEEALYNYIYFPTYEALQIELIKRRL